MANEIKATVQVNYQNGFLKDPFAPGSIGISQTALGCHRPTVIVNTSAYEAVPFGDISTPGICFGRNLDSSNYVTVGMSTSAASTAVNPFATIEAKEPFFLRLHSGVKTKLKWKANSAAVKMDLHVLED